MMHTIKPRIALIVTALFTILLALPVTQASTVLAVPGASTLDQDLPSNSVLGYEFVSSQDLMLTAIGIFDQGGNGISSPHTVAIWDDAGNIVSQQLFAAGGGELVDGFRYLDVAPLNLVADIKYVIGVFYFGGNTDNVLIANFSSEYTLDPRITLLGGRSRVGSLGVPNTETSEVFIGPNFQFTAVPIPAAVWLLAGALGVLGGLGRKRQKY